MDLERLRACLLNRIKRAESPSGHPGFQAFNNGLAISAHVVADTMDFLIAAGEKEFFEAMKVFDPKS